MFHLLISLHLASFGRFHTKWVQPHRSLECLTPPPVFDPPVYFKFCLKVDDNLDTWPQYFHPCYSCSTVKIGGWNCRNLKSLQMSFCFIYFLFIVFVVGNHRGHSNICENNIGNVETPERTVPNSHSSAPSNIWGRRNEDSHRNIVT